MNTTDILGDQFEEFIQIIKFFTNPTDQFLSEIYENPNFAIATIDDLYVRIKDIVSDIKNDLDNGTRISLSYLTKVRDAKAGLVDIRKELVEKVDKETRAAWDLIKEIEQMN